MRRAVVVVSSSVWLLASAAGAAQSGFDSSPIFQPPSPPRLIGPDAPLAPTPGGPPADVAFGAYQRGFFITALREAMARISADPRDAAAMTLIGEIYHDGIAVKQDFAEAARWYRLAAGLGDAAAAFQLGVMMIDGAPGLDKDPDAAKRLFEQAARAEHPGALYNLGVLALQDGQKAGKPDYAKAAVYFKRASEAGDLNGAYSDGVMLREGKGVDLDTSEAARWLRKAAEGGIISGQVEYAIMLFNGVGVERNEAGAAEIFRIAAGRRNPIAQNRLAHLYLTGRGVPKDLVLAALWHSFAKAAGREDPELDAATAKMTPEERQRLDKLIQQQAAF